MNKDHVLVEAKSEYTKQLVTLLQTPVYNKMTSIFDNCKENTRNKRDLLINAQKELQKIPHWNQAQIDHEVAKVTSSCDWIGELIAAIFISNVKILTSVKIGKDKKKIQITMPKTDHFIHKVYVNTANALFDNPFIFEAENKKSAITAVVKENIEDTIRTLLPFQNILQSYLGTELNDPSEDSVGSEDVDSDHDDLDHDAPDPDPEDSERGHADEPADQEANHETYSTPVEPEIEQTDPEPIANMGSQVAEQPSNGFFDPPQEVKNVVVNAEPNQRAPNQQRPAQRFFEDAIDETP